MNWGDQGRRPDQREYSAMIARWSLATLAWVAAILLALTTGCGKDPASAPVAERACWTEVITARLRNAAGDSIGTYTFRQRRCAR